MPDIIDDNATSRAAVLGSVRKALGRDGPDAGARERALAQLAGRSQGPRPALPADLVAHFAARAQEMSSTLERLGGIAEVPQAVARYLDALVLPPALEAQKARAGVCWPAFAVLDWASAGLTVEARPARGGDALGITGCFCAVAETGTLVFTTAAATPTTSMLLPATHVCVLNRSQVVAGMEEAFARVRGLPAGMPRGVHFVSGPSRTGDIEQTIVLGAHGPFRVHILLLE